MAALGRGPAGKGGGGDRPVGRSRRLFVAAVGCFLFFLVCLLSSRYDATVVLGDALVLSGRVGIRPLHGGSHDHRRESAEQRNDMAGTERVSDAVIRGDRNDDAEGDAAPEAAKRDSNAGAAGGSNSDEQAEPAAAEDDAGQDKSLLTASAATTAQPGAVQTTSPPHGLPGDITFTTTRADSVAQQRRPLCDTSDPRADVCDLAGDVRMDANASAFIVLSPAGGADHGPAYKIRPYPRKGDATSMGRVTEITVRTTPGPEPTPRCTVSHAEPAVVFSIGGYTGNLFHDFTDVIVPLYAAAQRYGGDVRLVVTDAHYSPWWLAKYGALLRGLSRHAPLDLAKAAAAREVHCFRHAAVGLRAHRELLIQRERSLDGVGMPDFARFLRRALSLPRNAPTTRTGKKPRLFIISRRGTRLLLNMDSVVRAAEEVGFEVVVSELSVSAAGDIAEVGRLINSFDAMVGVHGADLTNMVFLPPGATMVQIVPWGGLQWIARLDFGDPAEAMGLRYIQYEIAVHESTLKDKYPRGHEIFTNPTALHKKGFKFLRNTFLKGQDVVVDVDRFRTVLIQALENLRQ